ncbi:hypothetical protein BASA83_010406 [Batrachochytrium salamandrivorans]|nr:hypothetical protein BASA83_010406 [Batrachochytrium salamandrivorans]
MDQAIRIDNRIFERKQEQQYNPQSFRRNPPPTQPQPVSRIHSQQYQHRYVDNFNRQPMQQPSVPTTATPTQQRPTSDTWISILLGVAPSVFQTDSKGLVKDSALFVVSQDI